MKELIKIRDLKKYDLCFSCGNYPNLARVLNPIGYHAGDYGWNFDLCTTIIEKNDKYYSIALTLGYRCRGIDNKSVRELCRKYDRMNSNSYNADDFYNELEKILFK